MCFSRTCLKKELPNESCYVLKHALVHKSRQLQSGSREDQSTKPSSGFAFFFFMQLLSQILLHWKRVLMGAGSSCAPRCTLTGRHRQQHHPHQLHCAWKLGVGRKTTSTYSNGFYSPVITYHGYSSKQTLHTKLSLASSYFSFPGWRRYYSWLHSTTRNICRYWHCFFQSQIVIIKLENTATWRQYKNKAKQNTN